MTNATAPYPESRIDALSELSHRIQEVIEAFPYYKDEDPEWRDEQIKRECIAAIQRARNA